MSGEDTQELKDIIQELLVEVATLKGELDDLRSRGSVPTQEMADLSDEDREEAVFHTLKKIQSGKEERKLSKMRDVDRILGIAADIAIKDYKQHPPKHRR